MPILSVEKPLRDKLGDEATDSLINLINMSQDEQKTDVLAFVEEKFERRLSEEISGVEKGLLAKLSDVETELLAKLSDVETELLARISGVENRLGTKISENKSDMIKWMFIFWVGQFGVFLGILFAFFK